MAKVGLMESLWVAKVGLMGSLWVAEVGLMESFLKFPVDYPIKQMDIL